MRTSGPLRSFLGCALVILAGCGDTPAHGRVAEAGLTTGDLAPASLGIDDESGVTLGWVLHESDCVSCDAAPVAREVREVQREFGDRLAVRVLMVGTEPREVETFLRVERIRARLGTVDPHRYREQFGATPTPMLYLLDGREIVFMAPMAPGALGAGTKGGVEASRTINDLLARKR